MDSEGLQSQQLKGTTQSPFNKNISLIIRDDYIKGTKGATAKDEPID